MAKGEFFFEGLTHQTLKIVRKTGLPYFHFTEKHQFGISFGERFVNALQAIYDLGYENVIALGNDTPHLKSSEILYACRQLENNKFILGPSADGGFYLLGLPKKNFKAFAFLKLPWQTSQLSKEVLALFSGLETRVVLLKTLFDLDTAQDVKVFIARFQNISKSLLEQILAMFLVKRTAKPINTTFYPILYQSNLFNKGSPAPF